MTSSGRNNKTNHESGKYIPLHSSKCTHCKSILAKGTVNSKDPFQVTLTPCGAILIPILGERPHQIPYQSSLGHMSALTKRKFYLGPNLGERNKPSKKYCILLTVRGPKLGPKQILDLQCNGNDFDFRCFVVFYDDAINSFNKEGVSYISNTQGKRNCKKKKKKKKKKERERISSKWAFCTNWSHGTKFTILDGKGMW